MKWIVDDFWAAPVNNIPVCLTSNWQETDLHSQHLVTTNWWNSCSSAHLMIGATNGHVLLNVVFRKQNETTKYFWQEKWKYLDTFEHAMCNLEDLKRTTRLAVDMDKPCTFIVLFMCVDYPMSFLLLLVVHPWTSPFWIWLRAQLGSGTWACNFNEFLSRNGFWFFWDLGQ